MLRKDTEESPKEGSFKKSRISQPHFQAWNRTQCSCFYSQTRFIVRLKHLGEFLSLSVLHFSFRKKEVKILTIIYQVLWHSEGKGTPEFQSMILCSRQLDNTKMIHKEYVNIEALFIAVKVTDCESLDNL